mgnify:CR=1 FL=1
MCCRGNMWQCYYAFCTLCRDSYHPGMKCLTLDEQMQALQQRGGGGAGGGGGTKIDRAAQLRR